ncbi:MAG TPA: NUDIX domain-containing protein [Candidatus Paceibacterota bacterium]|nr:NUDIX domain-containing protein [Candidatus Paceibacterota bacterium]
MAHIHEKIDFTVTVFVVYRHKVLLRKHEKYGLWLAPGGHVELDEDPTQAALREVKEEVGLDLILVGNPIPPIVGTKRYRQLLPPKYLNRHIADNNGHEHVDSVYFARSETDVIIPEDPSDECRWLTKEEVEKNELSIPEDVRWYALDALKELAS